MKNITKLLSLGLMVAALGIMILPRLSSAQGGYVVSPAFTGNSSMNVATANQVCMSLPDNVAAQQSYCVFSGTVPSVVTIPDYNIMIHVTSSTTARVTWTTSTPTTSVLWYTENPSASNASLQYSNSNEGYVTYHTIDLAGINLQARHLFQVGGAAQGGGVQVASAFQLI